MGPLQPNGIISENTDLLFAFIIGIGFGFVLERSGFSSSRRLAGVFYGYDMVVLKVFFTAAITTMLGLLFFSLFGWIDLDLVYINPAYIISAIVGGVIMGAGFVTGGFCPGTSVCAASIGKIDALVFIAGLFIGVFIFAEAFPLFEKIYTATFIGSPKISETLGLSDGIFAFLLIVMAVGMFWVAEWAERKFTQTEY